MNVQIWSIVVPSAISLLIVMLMETIGLICISQLDDVNMMAGMGLAMTYVNIVCQAPLNGLNNALSVLIPIAYGQNDRNRCEILLSRGRFLNLIIFIPVSYALF
mmetsp:Transcript_36457/g.26529  ORF Transcript_36457/g.26529 Transcript_36457/m.26529 type:complete len:104 (+) Transcript_36457:226-537(+)